jgi:cytochrome c oxidase subunit II
MRFDANRRWWIRAAGAAGLGSTAALPIAQPQERSIRVVAHKFEFEPSNIVLKRGETVVLELTSLDVMMGFNLAQFDVRADLVPGRVTAVRLTPNRIGTFGFRCDVFCGDGHEEMDGTLTVTD